MIRRLRSYLGSLRYSLLLYIYWSKLPGRIRKIRSKEVIKVLFVISDLDSWKTEMLYLAMSVNDRFLPIIGVSTNKKYPYAKKDILDYISSKNYQYLDLDTGPNSIKSACPDLVFYGTPYTSGYSQGHSFYDNRQFVFCGVDYCFNITKHEVHLKHPWYDYCWQFYVEHEDVAKRKRELLGRRARNIKVTGVPLQDRLLLPKECFRDPWKDKTGKKRIIYAPHHSFKGSNGEGIEFSTFLSYGEDLLSLAQKYENQITIAFKPHPFLYIKLLNVWGKERTDAYYEQWGNMPNTQFENGEYLGLFKYSDAIIHDSASFILEYLYMNNPSMFLVADTNNIEEMFDFVQQGYSCYEHGQSVDDIESFILNVIAGVDSKKVERQDYISKQLVPPGGQTACSNIIRSLLEG